MQTQKRKIRTGSARQITGRIIRPCKEERVDDPGDYAVKNWIVKAQGFLIGCATSGFTSHYEEIMEGTYKKDLFAGTLAEGLVKLLGEIACKCVFKTRDDLSYGSERGGDAG